MLGVSSVENSLVVFSVSTGALQASQSITVCSPSDYVVSSACGIKDHVYYAVSSSKTIVHKCLVKHETTGITVFEWPSPIQKMLYVKDRLYALSECGRQLFIADLLAVVVESISLPDGVNAVGFQPADHGFVFLTTTGSLVCFHFNDGFSYPVFPPGLPSEGVQLLGSAKLRAIVRFPSTGKVVAVSECGSVEAMTGEPFHKLDAPFIIKNDILIKIDDTGRMLHSASSSLCVGRKESAAPLSVSLTHDCDEDEVLCPLCFCEVEEDGLTLDCGHSFHLECVEAWVKNWEAFKSKGEHIVFTNAYCPSGCKHLVRHSALPCSQKFGSLFSTVSSMKSELLATQYSSKTEDELLFYLCARCEKPFFGGEKVCFRMLTFEPVKEPSELVCDDCLPFSCPTHGKAFVQYTCRYCCNPATERSFGTRYLCSRCNARWEKVEPEVLPCVKADCPFAGNHPDPGCLLCLLHSGLCVDKVVPAPTKVE